MIKNPVAGIHYPGSLPELRTWFVSDAACLDYLDWLRWPEGFLCPWCAGVADWGQSGRRRCGDCGRHVTATSGTIFHRTRTPLSQWFEAAWLFTSSKQGLSALELQKVAALGSYQTAWSMLHKFRQAMSGTGRERLTGRVEVDEGLYGGAAEGPPGRGALGKTLVAAAVEGRGAGFGRIRMQVIDSASEESLTQFLAATIEPGSTLITDGWSSYPAAARAAGLIHERYVVSGSGHQAHELLPGVHRVFSLSKRVLAATYQGGVQPDHLQAYLDEYVFRFNRRHAKHRGLLFLRLIEQSVTSPPAPFKSLIARPGHRDRPHPKFAGSGTGAATLNGTPLDKPWRDAP